MKIPTILLWLSVASTALAAPVGDKDKDKIDDVKDWCPTAPETYNNIDDDDGCPDEKGELIKLEDDKITILEKIGFLSGKAQILGRSAALLDRVAALLKDNPQVQLVEIQGHTDNAGVPADNLKMSEQRANAVLNALVSRGVERTRLEAKGYGDAQPIESNDTDAGRSGNRRVSFMVKKSGARTAPAVNTDDSALMMASHGTVNVNMPNGVNTRGTKGLLVLNASQLVTGVDGNCEVNLPTGTRTSVAQNANVKIWTKRLNDGTTASKVKIIAGTIWAKVVGIMGGGKGETYDVETPNSVAGVRGTEFTINVREVNGKSVTELSTAEGAVALTVGGKTVEVPAGSGVVASGDPKKEPVVVSEPKPLPAVPTELDPYWGEYKKNVPLKWRAAPGVTYRVEVARDAFFQNIVANAPVEQASYTLVAEEEGDYFWRVRALRDGLESKPSQMFRFSVAFDE